MGFKGLKLTAGLRNLYYSQLSYSGIGFGLR
jgi:hypothetical protein